MSEKQFNPLEHSIVSALIRNEPHQQYEATDHHEALLFGIAREIRRVHSNHYQTSWDRWSDDPHIPGIGWRRYAYDCDCPEDGENGYVPRHLEDCAVCQPNFQFEDVQFTWYKNPGRGMSVNQDWKPEQWQEWFNRCLEKIREFDVIVPGSSNKRLAPLPNASNFYSAACHVLFAPSVEKDLVGDLQSLRIAAQEGQREISNEVEGDDNDYWKYIEQGDLSDRDVRLIALGIISERMRSTRGQ